MELKPLHLLDDEALGLALARSLHTLTDASAAWQTAATALWASPASAPLLAGALGGLPAAVPGAVATTDSAASRVRRWVAALVFDSATQAAPALGMRSVGLGGTRHLLYRVAGRDIDLRVLRHGSQFALAGQVLGPEEPGVMEVASLHNLQQPGRLAALDALGEFALQGLAGGDYRLTLRLLEDEIELPPLQLRPQAA